jgi:hypothetical protein
LSFILAASLAAGAFLKEGQLWALLLLFLIPPAIFCAMRYLKSEPTPVIDELRKELEIHRNRKPSSKN